MQRILLLFILLISTNLNAQIKASTTNISFGDLYKGSETYTDITFTNTSGKVQYLLTIQKPLDVYYIFSGKKILPDSSITIRFKINDKKKGRFNYDIDVYFSEPRDPITISLNGNVREMSQESSLTDCPDFNSKPPGLQNEFDMVVKVIDSITREPIPNAKVYIVNNGVLVGDYKTNNRGVVKKRMVLGYYYITAQRDPYESNFFEGYVNFKRNYVEIELSNTPIPPPVWDDPLASNDPDPINEPPVNEPPVDEPDVDTIEIVINDDPPSDPVVNDPPDDPVVTTPAVEPTELQNVPDSVFTPGYFKYNNITFILDVSSSMNGMGKMDLLKMSMIELAKILRAEDVVSMIKFSAEVETIMNGSSGANKDEIISTVQGLKTSSYTAGGDAIKNAYKISKKNYIEGGNNIVIMITDGIFNRGDKDYLETIKKNYEKQGIKFSVVGIKTSDYVTKHMQNIVANGGGDFIRILSVDDAMTKLIAEIRRTSFRF